MEIVSPKDESWAKLPFYAAHDVDEALIVDPKKRKVHWLGLRGDRYEPIERSGLIELGPRSWPSGSSGKKSREQFDLQSVVYREGEHYVAQCLNIDVSSFGDSEAEALANLQEALELYFEDAPVSDANPIEAAEVRTLTLRGA